MYARSVTTLGQGLGLALIGLIAGSVFGIEFGYDFTRYSPGTYLEVHQAAVRGLNDLLPVMGLVSLVIIVGLAVSARRRPLALGLYAAAAIGVAVAGLVTRLLNQPINAEVMTWSADAMPADWAAVRQGWWYWHTVRCIVSVAAFLLLIAGILADRRA